MKLLRTVMIPDDLAFQACLVIDGVTGRLCWHPAELAGTSREVAG